MMKKLSEYSEGSMVLEKAMFNRRSVREYSREKVKFESVSNILSSILHGDHENMEIYFTSKRVSGFKKGLYRFLKENKSVELDAEGKEFQQKLYSAGLQQEAICDAALVIVICGVYENESFEYHLKAGKLTQLMNLQIIAEGLFCVVIGAFSDKDIKKYICLPKNHHPLIILPIGHKDI